MNKSKVVVVPNVYHDESLISYIYRLADVNNLDKAWIYESLGINLSKIRTHGFQLGNEKIDTSILADITGIDQIVLDGLSI
ncbi:TniQ family protein [Paenibacillus sp. WQ 127069]|uniref:TniQ family protein n=1 Tax=Paenibacillus baimaensis TaxID=2982185 RepID=A0ABT2UJN2_9BACL|nr:TniQ family protein [Paenibacillus sp. WQ 127069]MCU6794853.1 TniQ family protein [Paenibacillus sp. WQ 127069]